MSERPAPSPKVRRLGPRTPLGWVAVILLALALVVAVGVGLLRFGVLTPSARLLIQARVSGLRLGPVGRLKVEGLGGDLWRDFTVRQLTITDEHGVWLQADNLTVAWDYRALVRRRLQISSLKAEQVTVIRRPSLAPKGPPSRGLPVAFDIRAMSFRLKTLPAFSQRPGLYDVGGKLRLLRAGRGEEVQIHAASLTHVGDFVDVSFEGGPTRPLQVVARALEAKGGAFAGALGLPASQPFSVDLTAAGAPQGQTGRIDLDLMSGGKRPLWAHGGWTSQGGVIAGRVSLGASSLTRGAMRMAGPDAVVALAARRAPGGVYGAALRLRSRNLVLAAEGPVDPAAQSSKGLKLAVRVTDLSKIVKTPELGAGSAQGLVSGGPSAWRFLGTARVEKAGFDGYRLASVSGPVVLTGRGRQIGVTATLAGAGGAGSTVLASLGGPTPRLAVDLSRLADGRLLIRKADLKGQGLTASGSGTMGLLGGLNFKGTAVVSALEGVEPRRESEPLAFTPAASASSPVRSTPSLTSTKPDLARAGP